MIFRGESIVVRSSLRQSMKAKVYASHGQRLFGRHTKTLLPVSGNNLTPGGVSSVRAAQQSMAEVLINAEFWPTTSQFTMWQESGLR